MPSQQTRLPTQFETRLSGYGFDKYGRPTQKYTTYHIGHGQQLARRREAARQAELTARSGGGSIAVTEVEATETPTKPKRTKKAAA